MASDTHIQVKSVPEGCRGTGPSSVRSPQQRQDPSREERPGQPRLDVCSPRSWKACRGHGSGLGVAGEQTPMARGSGPTPTPAATTPTRVSLRRPTDGARLLSRGPGGRRRAAGCRLAEQSSGQRPCLWPASRSWASKALADRGEGGSATCSPRDRGAAWKTARAPGFRSGCSEGPDTRAEAAEQRQASGICDLAAAGRTSAGELPGPARPQARSRRPWPGLNAWHGPSVFSGAASVSCLAVTWSSPSWRTALAFRGPDKESPIGWAALTPTCGRGVRPHRHHRFFPSL